ncbi:MAG: DUF2892 domain-containing protein [Bacteroidota bacterium]|jgi:uncharacterized membrane protein HdeD (DUF308 family)
MKKNMGGTDRIIRIIVAIVALGLYFTNTISGILGIVALVVAGIFLLTSFVSFCPLYTVIGISTCSVSKK